MMVARFFLDNILADQKATSHVIVLNYTDKIIITRGVGTLKIHFKPISLLVRVILSNFRGFPFIRIN